MYSRMNDLVLLLTDGTGEVWLATPDELRADIADAGGRLRRHETPARFVSVWEVTGTEVVGPMHLGRSGTGTGIEQWTFTYPNGSTAFVLEATPSDR